MLLGAHVSGGIGSALERAEAIGADAVQIFTQSPRAWRLPERDPASLDAFGRRRAQIGLGAVLCHAIYLVNLASERDDVYEKSVATMRDTTEVACAIEADAVVFHVGSHLGAGLDGALARVVPALEQVLELCSERTWLLMENSAGAGGTIGRSIAELAVLHEALGRHPRLGVCLDSCHLYVSGEDVTERRVLDRVLDDLDAAIGLERLRALHVNDAKAPLGSNRDRHDNVGEGLMGERLGVFVGHPSLQGLPALMEVPGPDGKGPGVEEMGRLRELHARWTATA